MQIKGFNKLSLIDYPDKTCSIIFLGGCNFRCPYCHNIDLVKNPEKLPTIEQEEVISYLDNHREWIDGVVISGGEPCLNKELFDLCKKIKELGFPVKLDTNGSNPDMLQSLIKNKIIDYIAMDIKAPLEKYEQVTKVKVLTDNIKKSIEIIKNSKLDYEFRTTLLPALHSKEDILNIAELLKGAERYYLQQFRNGVTLEEDYQNKESYSEEELKQFAEMLKPFFSKVEVRS